MAKINADNFGKIKTLTCLFFRVHRRYQRANQKNTGCRCYLLYAGYRLYHNQKLNAPTMKIFLIFCRLLLFGVATTFNFEYLFNRQSSNLLLLLAIVIEISLYLLLLHPLIKKLIK